MKLSKWWLLIAVVLLVLVMAPAAWADLGGTSNGTNSVNNNNWINGNCNPSWNSNCNPNGNPNCNPNLDPNCNPTWNWNNNGQPRSTADCKNNFARFGFNSKRACVKFVKKHQNWNWNHR
ncbi:MAG: hypothetical protein QOI57_3212 [Rubrobacteraceae bacterium]|jgi:hypothetical protein|nr:hypothetical protein [Rubrobacteraceae bacterium]